MYGPTGWLTSCISYLELHQLWLLIDIELTKTAALPVSASSAHALSPGDHPAALPTWPVGPPKHVHVQQVCEFKARYAALKETLDSGSCKLDARGFEVCASSSKVAAYRKAAGTASDDIWDELRFEETV